MDHERIRHETHPPRLAAHLVRRSITTDAAEAIDWLCRAFGFEVQLKVEGEGGRIEHSELVFGGGLIMVGHERRRREVPD